MMIQVSSPEGFQECPDDPLDQKLLPSKASSGFDQVRLFDDQSALALKEDTRS